MSTMEYLAVTIALICGGTALLSLNRKPHEKLGKHEIMTDRDSAIEEVKNIISMAKGYAVWSIAGELDPSFYGKIYNELQKQISENGISFEVICGPRICIRDEQYDKYVDESGRNIGDYWKAHPLVSLAHEYQESGKVKIYIRKPEIPSYETHTFCSTNPNSATIIERKHHELLPSPVLIEKGTRVGYEEHWSRFESYRASASVRLWNPASETASDLIKFVRRSELAAEAHAD